MADDMEPAGPKKNRGPVAQRTAGGLLLLASEARARGRVVGVY